MRLLSLAAAAALLSTPEAAAAQEIEIRGDSLATRRVTRAELAGLPRVEARVSDHGTEALFSGVSLAAVLKLAGVPMDSLRGRHLTTYVVVEAADGYRVVLSIGEIDPGLTGRAIFLADKRDGEALPANQAPWRLIIPGETRASRWVRQVTALVVKKG
jgi:hypothetical protein